MLISIVLVHGTWAHGSRWPMLEAEIRRAFAAEEVTIQYLNWSGRNSVSARLSAAEALVQLLEDDIRERPDARRFIVAHSHGGTVALLALRQTILRRAMTGVICLSTPFLLVRPRRFSELGTSVATFGVVLSLLVATIAVALLRQSVLPLVFGATVAFAARVAAIRGAWRSSSFIDRVSLPSVSAFPVLIVRAPDDEASLSLGLLQATNRMVWVIWRIIGLYLRSTGNCRCRALDARSRLRRRQGSRVLAVNRDELATCTRRGIYGRSSGVRFQRNAWS